MADEMDTYLVEVSSAAGRGKAATSDAEPARVAAVPPGTAAACVRLDE